MSNGNGKKTVFDKIRKEKTAKATGGIISKYPFGEGKSLPHQMAKGLVYKKRERDQSGSEGSPLSLGWRSEGGLRSVGYQNPISFTNLKKDLTKKETIQGGAHEVKHARVSAPSRFKKPVVKPKKKKSVLEKTKDKNRQWLTSHGEDPNDPMFN